jgi:hypothetical protein
MKQLTFIFSDLLENTTTKNVRTNNQTINVLTLEQSIMDAFIVACLVNKSELGKTQ